MTISASQTSSGPSEATNIEDYGKAMLNILEDFSEEKGRLEDVQRAAINILEDFASEKARLEDAQRAMLNLLDDFSMEREKTEAINSELREAFDSLRLAKEAADAANRELEAFAYSVSHDLRAPLRSIAGFSHFLMEDYHDKLDEEGKDSLNRIFAATDKMGRLIDDLLNLSRLTRTEMTRNEVNISSLVRKIVEAKERAQPERAVDFVIQDHLFVKGDGQLLNVVLENLLENALKFTGKSESARVEFGAMDEEGKLIYFIRDNGVGFDMEYAGKLFQPFQRVHAMDEFPGTGIGLATVKRIIERHGGRVWIDAEEGKGTTVYFTL
ncbi:MAG: ATP-binding protein [Syntrophobacteraceae bacterium]|jgi:light-regulated signal transduction histidine kinase (bacteriophytochrome)